MPRFLWVLWAAHLAGFAMTLAFFFVSRHCWKKDVKTICQKDWNVLLKVFTSLVASVGWALAAFLWEFSWPYLKSSKFRKVVDVLFD